MRQSVPPQGPAQRRLARPPAPLASLPLLLLACLVTLTAAQDPPAIPAGQLVEQAGQCPVSVRYEVSLGQGAAAPQVPIFVAAVTIQNNLNYSIEEWRLGWEFPYGSVIKSQQDIFDPYLMLLTPDSAFTTIESLGGNHTVLPQDELFFNFLANKGAGAINASNPYGVGALEEVAFNNMRCTMINSAPVAPSVPGPPGAADATSAPPAELAPEDATDLQVDYTPIEYVDQPLVSTFTQFLVRLTNVRNTSAINMTSVNLQYWFDGPVDGTPMFAQRSPDQFFTVRCEWATTGCDSVSLQLRPGYDSVPGAGFMLNISLNAKAGLLLPSGEHALPAFFLGNKGVDTMDILITLTTKRGVALLNSTQDYSFLETPVEEAPAGATIIPRRALPNPHIPAYLNGSLVWGVLPRPPASQPAGTSQAPTTEATQVPGLPAGITCESIKDGLGQNCGLMAVYCCEVIDSMEEPSPVIPEVWPPPALPAPATEVAVVPGAVDDRSLTAPATESSTPPASPPANTNGDSSPSVSAVGAAVPASPSQKSSSSIGMIAGIAAGLAGVAALAAAGGFVLFRRRRRRQQRGGKLLLPEGQQEMLSVEINKGGGSPDSGGRPTPALFVGVPQGSAYKGGREAGLTPVMVNGGGTPRPLWGGGGSVHGVAPGFLHGGSEVGTSVQSSPSKAGSLAPLLRTQLSAGGTLGRSAPLIKFPSGASGVSSHDNPMFDVGMALGQENGWGGSGDTLQSVLPQHMGSWEMQSQVVTQQAFHLAQQAAQAAAAEAAAEAEAAATQAEAEEDWWRPDVLAMMERKAATAPSVLGDPRQQAQRAQRRQRQRGRSGGDAGGDSSSDESEEEQCGSPDAAGMPAAADWQLRRTKSWDGHMHNNTCLGDALPMFMRRPRGPPQQLLRALPPMPSLGAPVLMSSECAPDVDLFVDYESEIKPFLGRCLGTGGFGAVYECTWRGQRVAVKKLPHFGGDEACSESMYTALLREIELASKFSSDRLVKVHGACTADCEHVCLIMELLEGGNLFQRIYDRCKRRMGYLEILQLAHDVAAGLAYLHPSVVHRDLKPQNILMDADGRAKLADFGISRVKDPTKSYLSQVTNDNGTPNYMAPEQFNGSRVDEKVDVYALGVILNECYTRRQPWRDSQHFFQIILKVAINGERPWMDPDCPEPLRRLITKCWHQDPHMRPSCAEVMRLTAFMIQEEVHRWEQLQSHGSGGAARLPVASRGPQNGQNGVRQPSVLPQRAPPPVQAPVEP